MKIGGNHIAAAVIAIGTTLALTPALAKAAPDDGLIQLVPYYRYYPRPYYGHRYYGPYHRGYYGYGPHYYHRGYYRHHYYHY